MKVLFIPVSGKEGIGEYMRSMILAQSVEAAFPDSEIRFALSLEAPYAKDCPYPTLLTKRSPTYHTKEVSKYIDDFQPDIVVFDASGRAKQIRYAKKSGAYTVFIAQNDKKIKRGLKLNRLINTDLLLIAQPEFTMSTLSSWSLAKLRWLKKELPIYLGCVFVPPSTQQEKEILAKYNLNAGEYVFASAGSGGHFFPDGSLAADGYQQALVNAELSLPFVQVWGANYQGKNFPQDDDKNLNLTSIDNLEFIALLKNSKAALLNGGGTLLQALSLRVPFVAAPVSSDQPQRIEKALNHSQCFLPAQAEVSDITKQLSALIQDETLAEIKEKLESVNVKNGYDEFPQDINNKLNDAPIKYLLYAEFNYAYSMLRPLQDELRKRNKDVKWFLAGQSIDKGYLKQDEYSLEDIKSIRQWRPDVVIAPGNMVPNFIPGVKVDIFHGFNVAKATRNDDKGHFRIRGCYDLYCTQGPATTEGFLQRASKHGFFGVEETGWPVLDDLFKETNLKRIFQDTKPTIIYCSTFTEKLSSAPLLFERLKHLTLDEKWNWIIQFHPKMPISIVNKYKTLQKKNVVFIETDNILPLLKQADVMLCDTSSVMLMFSVLNKPIVTFRNRTVGNTEYLINVENESELEQAIEYALTKPKEVLELVVKNTNYIHPYSDGLSSERVVLAIESFIKSKFKTLKPKPINFLRNLRERKKLKYWFF